jgi:iron complex transport system permease protein
VKELSRKSPRETGRRAFVLSVLGLLLLAALVLATGLGAVSVAPASVLKAIAQGMGIERFGVPQERESAIILYIRLPRVITALLVGSALAVSGAAMQGLFRNPMASPGILGVSAGGSLGAVLAVSTGWFALNLFMLPLFAMAGSFLAASAVYALATRRGSTSLLFIILAGLAISSFFNGLISAVLLVSKEHEVSQFIFWTMGGLDSRRWEHVRMMLPVLLPALGLLLLLARDLNLFMLGEEGAHALGMNVEVVKKTLMGLAALLTGVSVAVSGTVGFVGLLVPHLLRLLLGPDHRLLLPASALGGGLFLVICDTVGRMAFAPFEIRVGIVTALLGSPYLLYLIFRYQRRGRIGFAQGKLARREKSRL